MSISFIFSFTKGKRPGYTGKRFYLAKLREEKDICLLNRIRGIKFRSGRRDLAFW